MQQRLTAAPGPARLEVGEILERVIFYRDYDGNDLPPMPRITAPAGVRAEFTRWAQLRPRLKSKGFPARWQGEVRLELAGEAPPEPAEVLLQVGPDQKAAIPLKFE
jgi:hypothetical protein